MIHYKKPEEIEIMHKAGEMLASVLWEVMAAVKPGVSELELDRLAEKLIRQKGGTPGFMKVPGYKHTICASTNDVVVHGIPTDYKLKPGDIIGVDCGVFLDGFHSDMAETVKVPDGKKDHKDAFLAVGKRALEEAIAVAKGGNRIGHISQVIQRIVEKEGGYSVSRALIGHGVGKELHEDPEVPGFLRGKIDATPLLKPGMVIAIEVIYNEGKADIVYKGNDGWTIASKDGSLSGVFERTIAITDNDPIVLTSE